MVMTETRRCRSWSANPGQRGLLARLAVRMPSTVVALSRTRDMRPVGPGGVPEDRRAHCATSRCLEPTTATV